jgi:hypothetical protein
MMRRLLVVFTLVGSAACSPEPRSASYFEAHAEEAAKVVADCRTGAHRGQECTNAQTAVAAAKRDERMEGYRKGF